MLKQERIRDQLHLDWIKTLPCMGCKSSPCDPDHVNLPMNGAKGLKACDSQTVPLCRICHTDRHSMGVKSFYEGKLGRSVYEVVEIGKKLFAVSGDTDKALWILLGRKW